jgi:tricorn protease
MRFDSFFAILCALAIAGPCVASQTSEEGTLLLHQPAVSKDHLAFVYGGDIWVTDRDGSHPVQLTSNPAAEFAPHFSPDGKLIAFSGNYDNNTDVYVIPVEGGQARRLTWHPAADIVTGWSPDGKRLAYRPYIMAYAGPSGWRQHRGGDTPPI